jgi:hypothetical protein
MLSQILTSEVDGGEWSASRVCRLTHVQRSSGTHEIGCVGPRGGLDVLDRRKIFFPLPGIEPRFLGNLFVWGN